jgi:hypothetical protein
MLREALGGAPFADFPIISGISAAVGEIDMVAATVGNKFSECPI